KRGRRRRASSPCRNTRPAGTTSARPRAPTPECLDQRLSRSIHVVGVRQAHPGPRMDSARVEFFVEPAQEIPERVSWFSKSAVGVDLRDAPVYPAFLSGERDRNMAPKFLVFFLLAAGCAGMQQQVQEEKKESPPVKVAQAPERKMVCRMERPIGSNIAERV